MITVHPRTQDERDLWAATAELALTLSRGSWTLIGAQMVFLLAYEHGLPIPRTSGDVDIMVDVRAVTGPTEQTAQTLQSLGYELDQPTPDGRAHRFRRGRAVVDVLGPDGLGPRTTMFTLPPARTIAVPGGSQALQRSRLVDVDLAGRVVQLPCPSLLGAILLKARAVEIADDPDKHRGDLALLLAGVADPRSARSELSPAEMRWLRRRTELLHPDHPAWRNAPRADDALTAFEILTEH